MYAENESDFFFFLPFSFHIQWKLNPIWHIKRKQLFFSYIMTINPIEGFWIDYDVGIGYNIPIQNLTVARVWIIVGWLVLMMGGLVGWGGVFIVKWGQKCKQISTKRERLFYSQLEYISCWPIFLATSKSNTRNWEK